MLHLCIRIYTRFTKFQDSIESRFLKKKKKNVKKKVRNEIENSKVYVKISSIKSILKQRN